MSDSLFVCNITFCDFCSLKVTTSYESISGGGFLSDSGMEHFWKGKDFSICLRTPWFSYQTAFLCMANALP